MLLKKICSARAASKKGLVIYMTILIEKEIDDNVGFDYNEILESVVLKSIELENCPYECEVNITFTDDSGICKLNKDFRGIDAPTDVLSFPMADYSPPANFSILENDEVISQYFNPESGELLLGDIVISVERAKKQAAEYGHSIKREICFLTAHSMLHLMGYDHMTEKDRKLMENKQDKILNALGIIRD